MVYQWNEDDRRVAEKKRGRQVETDSDTKRDRAIERDRQKKQRDTDR